MKNLKNSVTRKYDSMIRERAILRTKSKIALQGKTKDDFTEEQVLDIVAEEERELRSSAKTRVLYGVIAFLGFGMI